MWRYKTYGRINGELETVPDSPGIVNVVIENPRRPGISTITTSQRKK